MSLSLRCFGKVYQIVYLVVLSGRRRFCWLLSEDILAELERKLSSAKFTARIDAIGLTPLPVPDNAIRDPKDRMILACAVGGNADFIVSGDKDLLVLKTYQGIQIVTPSGFLDIVKPSSEALT